MNVLHHISPYAIPGVRTMHYTLKDLEQFVANYYKLSPQQLRARTRQFKIVAARRLFYDLAYKQGFSLSAIGRYMGKNHATVWHNIRVLHNEISVTPSVKQEYTVLCESLLKHAHMHIEPNNLAL